MALSIDTILERVEEVDLAGLLGVKKQQYGGRDVVAVEFWRIRGAFRNDKDATITLVIDPDGPHGDLFFLAPNLDECEPRSLDLTIYMDANLHTVYGAHRWDPEDNEIRFSYTLPVPADGDDFPDVATFQRLLKDMYEGLIFHEIKKIQFSIGSDDMLSDDEKKEKVERLLAMYKRLTNPEAGEDDAV